MMGTVLGKTSLCVFVWKQSHTVTMTLLLLPWLQTLQRDCGLVFFRWCFLFKYLYFDTVHVSIEKKGNTEPILFILHFLNTQTN